MFELDRLENLGVKRILDRGTGKLVAENEGAALYFDSLSEGYFLICDGGDAGLRLLEENQQLDIRLLSVTNVPTGLKIFEKYGFNEKLNCYQLAYYGDVPELNPSLKFRWATEKDLPVLTASYDLVSAEEMATIVERQSMLLGYEDEEMVGFIGEHLEGSMGLLLVFPEYRRKGYASELEKAYMKHTMEKGYIPFGQVVEDNMASLELQQKLGFERSEEKIIWMWK